MPTVERTAYMSFRLAAWGLNLITLHQRKHDEEESEFGIIRNVDPRAYAYLVKSMDLLQAAGYYKDSIL